MRATLYNFGSFPATVHRLVKAVSYVAAAASYCNIILNTLIYIIRYEEVERSLVDIAHRIAAS